MKTYITGRNCQTFSNLNSAIEYADKWRDKSISVYVNKKYHSTIHKINGNWNN